MNRHLVLALLLCACTSAESVSVWGGASPPPMAVELVAGPLVLGLDNVVTVTGLPPAPPRGVVLGLMYSVSGSPSDWCPPSLGGVCTGLADPGGLLATRPLDAGGEARFVVPAPTEEALLQRLPALPEQIAFQVAAMRGQAVVGLSEVVSVPVFGTTRICDAVAAVTLEPVDPRGDDVLVANLDLPSSALLWGLVDVQWAVDGVPSGESGTVFPSSRTTKHEVWSVAVTADLPGGTCTQSASTTIGNSAPSCVAAAVEPSPVFANQDLACSCAGYADVDGDPPGAPACTWTDGGGLVVGLDCALPASVVRAGDPLTCTVAPWDGEAPGAPVALEVDPRNAQPLLIDIALTPSSVPVRGTDAGTTLTCGVTSVDLELDPIELQVTWWVNGQAVDAAMSVTTEVQTSVGALSTQLGRQLVRGDLITCEATVRDGVSVEPVDAPVSASLAIGNTVPEVVAVALADVRGDELLHCEPTFFDADGDVPQLEIVYEWESAFNGPLPSTRQSQSTVGLSRGDTVTCTARVSDGADVAAGTSPPAQILDRVPTSTGLAWTPVDQQRSQAGQWTIACKGLTFSDGDGDPEGWVSSWLVDGVVVKSGTTGPEGLTLRAVETSIDAGHILTCRTQPWDGLEAGAIAEHSAPTRIGSITDCLSARAVRGLEGPDDFTCTCTEWENDFHDQDPSDDLCSWYRSPDANVRSLAGETWNALTTTPLRTGCTIPVDDRPMQTGLRCAYRAYDGREVAGGQRAGATLAWGENTIIFSVPPTTPSWSSPPSVQLEPGVAVPLTFEDDFVCTWDHSGLVGNAYEPIYQVQWRVNGVLVQPLRSYVTQTDLGYGIEQQGRFHAPRLFEFASAAGALGPVLGRVDPVVGDTVACGVAVNDGWQSNGWTWSASTTYRDDLPGDVLRLDALPSDGVAPAETFSCGASVAPSYVGDMSLQLRGSPDGSAWSVLDVASTTGGTEFELTLVVDAGTPAFLDCQVVADDGGGPVVQDTSAPVRVFNGTPVIGRVAVTPAAGDACLPRACDVEIVEPVEPPARGLDYLVAVQWSVGGGEQAAPVVVQVRTGAGGLTTSVPAPLLQAAPGDTLSCAATVTRLGSTVSASLDSGPAVITGALPGVGSATIPSVVRTDGVVTCVAAGLSTDCAVLPDVAFAWTLDGVEVGTGASLDTRDLPAGGELRCSATAVDAGGLAGVPVVSNPAELLPGRWRILGAAAEGYAGMSVAVVGDLGGDGLPELAIGAPNMDHGPDSQAGRLYLVDGTAVGGTTLLAEVDDQGRGGSAWPGESGGWDMYRAWCNDPSNTLCVPEPAGTSSNGLFAAPLGDGLGTRVAGTGDLDGDGTPDLVVSAPYALSHGDYLTGRTYGIFSQALARPSFSIGQLQRAGGYTIDGVRGVDRRLAWAPDGASWRPDRRHDGHLAGFGLATADLDGDGYQDVILGAPNAEGDVEGGSGTALNAGGVWVVPGSPELDSVWLGDVGQGAPGVRWWGVDLDRGSPWVPISSQLGRHLARVGDMDGDGDDEVLVSHTGGAGWDGGWWNTQYVVQGGPLRTLHLADATEGVRRITVPGGTYGMIWAIPDALVAGKSDLFGYASGVGDVNGDGLADLAVPYVEVEGGQSQTEIAVFFGGAGTGDIDVEGPDRGDGGFVVEGTTVLGRHDMITLGALGDVDGDGLDDIGMAYRAIGTGQPSQTKLAVIYGRTGTTPLTWADLRSGLGGHIVDLGGGDLPREITGGDVDGDGLADAVIGLPFYDDAAAGDNVGRVEVWFGRNLRGHVDQFGTRGDDLLVGTAAGETLVGGQGHDMLEGAGGPDVLYGGAGDDELTVVDAGFARVRGGTGRDVLVVDGPALDLAEVRGRLSGIEVVDLTRTTTTLTASRVDVLRVPELSRSLTVLGEAGDVLVLPDGGWADQGTRPSGERVLANGAATLVVDPGVALDVAPRVVVGVLEVDEGAPVGTVVGNISSVELAGGVVDLSVAAGPWFRFDRVNEQLVVDAEGLDHETLDRVDLAIRAEGPTGLVTTLSVAVSILDVPEPPSFLGLPGRSSVVEGAELDTVVAQLAATDPDLDDVLSYLWVGEQHGPIGDRRAFDVDAVTGVVTVRDGTLLDFETAPVVALTVEVVDLDGLSASRTIMVDLIDQEATTVIFTVPFLAEDQTLVDPSDPLVSAVIGAAGFSTDLALPPGQGETELVGVDPGEQLTIQAEAHGTVSSSLEVAIQLPMATSYMPIETTISFPDGVVLGQPFLPTSDWTLQDDALFQGSTLGYDVVFGFDLAGVDFSMFDPSGVVISGFPAINTQGDIQFGLDPLPLTGAKLDILYPDGIDTSGAPLPVDEACAVPVTLCPLVEDGSLDYEEGDSVERAEVAEFEEECPLVGYRPTPQRCDLLRPDVLKDWLMDQMLSPVYGGGIGIDDPDMVIAPGNTTRALEIANDPMLYLYEAGLPRIGLMWGTGRLPVPGVGYYRFDYTIDRSNMWWTLDSHELYSVRAEQLIGTLTFEGGTTLSADLRDGFGEITLPVDEDVNGDGRVVYTLDLELDATLRKVWIFDMGGYWHSVDLMWSARSYLYDYDLEGNITGEHVVMEDGWGPWLDAYYAFGFGQARVESWPLPGFQTVSVQGAVQLTAP